MAHIAFTAEREDKRTPDAWLPVAAQIADYARGFAGRGDIVANVGPGIGGPYGTACWNPMLADMDVNTDTCLPGIGAARVDFHDPIFQLGAMPFVGAVTHEAAHARWSCWVPADLLARAKAGDEAWSRALIQVVVALEESRIEYLAVRQDPSKRDALAQCALSIVLRDFHVGDTLFGASISAALTVGRYALFSRDELADFRRLLLDFLPADLLATFESLIREYHALPAHLAFERIADPAYCRAMFDIAERWLAAIREAADEPTEGEGEGEGEPGEGSGSGKGTAGIPGEGEAGDVAIAFMDDDAEGAEPASGDLADKIREAAGEAAMDREADALDERAEKIVERKIADAKADRERDADGSKMMESHHGEKGAHGYSEYVGSHRAPAREATGAERAAANRLGARLGDVTWHDKAVTKVNRVLPGGKLRPRAAVQQAAADARGGRERVPMWRAKERHHTDETPVTVGILTDVSGSMGGVEEASAVLTYVLSHAVSTIEGKVATAVFGNRGYLVNRAYEKADKVQPWRAKDGTEAFREAALLIDKELTLLNGSGGARILVIFTDSHLVNPADADYARTFMRLCKAKGVSVVWVDRGGKPVQNFGYGALVNVSGDAAQIATTLGDAIVAEVRKVEAARG